MVDISLSRVVDFGAVEDLWRSLEPRADGSFFRSWIWTGCLVEERFLDPVLLTAWMDDKIVGLGLFTHRRPRFIGRSTLWLGESGNPQYDAIFIEHNGLLLDRSRPKNLLGACLLAAQRSAIGSIESRRGRALVLSGVEDEYVAAATSNGLNIRMLASRAAPYLNLDMIRKGDGDFLGSISANSRYLIRRSERRYAEAGPIAIRRARTVDEAQTFLTALASLHQAHWVRRGKPGAFGNPLFERFHRALICRAFASGGGADLLKVTAGTKVLGYLYNLVSNGYICSYQSGFDYETFHAHQRPGLTCHHKAIEMYLAEGARCYDFLAGPSQYKLSLSNGATSLHWLRIAARSR